MIFGICTAGRTAKSTDAPTEQRSRPWRSSTSKEFEYKLATNQLDQQSDIALDTLKAKYLEHCQAIKKESTYQWDDLPRVNRFVEYRED